VVARREADAVNRSLELGRRVPVIGVRWSSTATLVALVLISRVLFLEGGALAFLYLPHAWVQNVPGYLPPTGSFWFQALWGPWAHWDGYWYLSIAHLGYAGRPLAAAFFPLYPLAVRLFGGTVMAGILISSVSFGLALVVLYRLTAETLSPRAAWFTVVTLAFFPTSFYFNSVYPEALILLLSVTSVYLAHRGRPFWAGLVAALASAASVDGLLLALPLALYLRQHKAPRSCWLSLALVPGGLLVYMAKLNAVFGNPFVFQTVQTNWGRAFAPFVVTIWNGLVAALANLPDALSLGRLFSTGQPLDVTSNVWNIVFAAAAVAGLGLAARRLPLPLWLYALVVLLVPFSYPSAGVPFMSMPRFLLSAWPVFMGWGAYLAQRPAAVRPYLAASLAVGVVLVALFATAHWVA
jgi:hypothetical protein